MWINQSIAFYQRKKQFCEQKYEEQIKLELLKELNILLYWSLKSDG